MSYLYRDEVDKIQSFSYEDEDGKERWFSLVNRTVLSVLANHANKDGECWPGYGLISKEAMCDRRSALTSVAVLRHLGLVYVEAGVERLSNTYRLDLEAIQRLASGKPQKKPKRKGNFGKGKKQIMMRGKVYTRVVPVFREEEDYYDEDNELA